MFHKVKPSDILRECLLQPAYNAATTACGIRRNPLYQVRAT